MDNYYEIMWMSHEEAELLVGEEGYFNRKNRYKVIHLDETFESRFSTKYSVMQVWDLTYGKTVNKKTLGVLVPGTDDYTFRALFYETSNLNLYILENLMFEWAARYNYRYINCHALEDYCRYHGAYDIDWS